jgi:hypothetical protein
LKHVSYHRRPILNSNRHVRSTIEDQNSTITTSNMIDTDDQYSFTSCPPSSSEEGHIRYMHNGRRFICRNSQWHALCDYDHLCRNPAKHERQCTKHFHISQQKQRTSSKLTYRQMRQSSIDTRHEYSYSLNPMMKQMSSDTGSCPININGYRRSTRIQLILQIFDDVRRRSPINSI